MNPPNPGIARTPLVPARRLSTREAEIEWERLLKDPEIWLQLEPCEWARNATAMLYRELGPREVESLLALGDRELLTELETLSAPMRLVGSEANTSVPTQTVPRSGGGQKLVAEGE
jgi:hypothetical protein